ncbi:MAG TPA: hypothetical protein PLD73_03190 [Candidatus Hydrogenedentes bacterium]|jgi:hypothetical protein|nr:hypothetical protein [Candidatus Hydrogenedentota bacterium]HPJ98220.1 hypothetical protein [Candidatus Hydrogenedentota bacterium]
MKSRNVGSVLILALAAAWCTGGAWAAGSGPEVTVSISGSLNDMLPVLQLLRNMGFGFESPDDAEKPLRLEVHSVVTDGDLIEGAAAGDIPGMGERPDQAALPDTPGLYHPAADPASAKPGDHITVSAMLVDPERRVDTMSARIVGAEGVLADLYNDGTHGDATPNDATWTGTLILPSTLLTGSHLVELAAYDNYGDPVAGENGEPMRLRIPIEITK